MIQKSVIVKSTRKSQNFIARINEPSDIIEFAEVRYIKFFTCSVKKIYNFPQTNLAILLQRIRTDNIHFKQCKVHPDF